MTVRLTAFCARASSLMPANAAGYSIAPTPMIVPWPCISRGTECSVPMVPGLVRLIVVPAKSSVVSLPCRARRTMSSYAARTSAKSIVSAALMLATTSEREPSLACRSMARPRLTCSGTTSAGLPSTSAKELFISGWSRSALTIA